MERTSGTLKTPELTPEQVEQASDNGILRWKEYKDIEHLKSAALGGCMCDLCAAVREVIAESHKVGCGVLAPDEAESR
jgi:hypothetical protein